MALSIETIPFTIRSGVGTQTISHVHYPSIAAKALLFFTVDGSGTTSIIYSYGVDDGTTHVGVGAGFGAFGTILLSARGTSSQYSLISEQAQVAFGGAQMRFRGWVSAIHVGSFEITTDLNNTPGANWFAVMIGGSDVECATGVFSLASSGSVSLSFAPKALIMLGSVTAGTTSSLAGALPNFGFATLCGPDTQMSWGIAVGPTSHDASSYLVSNVVLQTLNETTQVISNPVSVSFTPGGFNVTVVGTPVGTLGYLAIGGADVSANLVQITQPTVTGVQNTAITATNPVASFFSSVCKVHTAGVGSVDANLSFGVYDGFSNHSQWAGCIDNAATAIRDSQHPNTSVVLATATGASPPNSTINAQATCTLASTNIALNWTTVDSTQRELWALVLAQNLTAGTNACGANALASITVIKNTTPIPGGATLFPFTTTGGLAPATFNLQNGESQIFSGLGAGTYGVSESVPDGWTVSYNVSDSSPHDAIVLSAGEAVTVTVTNTFVSTATQLRVYRRFALPYSENKQMFLSRLEIVEAAGVGNTDDPDPVITMRISRDGGNTWGIRRNMRMGTAAQYFRRTYLTRLGRGRNLVAELWCDDAVFVAWVQCVVNPSEGAS